MLLSSTAEQRSKQITIVGLDNDNIETMEATATWDNEGHTRIEMPVGLYCKNIYTAVCASGK